MGFAVAGVLAFTAQAQAMEVVEQGVAKNQQGAPTSANWTGFYLSGQAGGAWSASGLQFIHGETSPPPGGAAALRSGSTGQNIMGLMGVMSAGTGSEVSNGAHASYNWGRESVVYGIDGELNYGERVNHLAAIRGRLGVASDKWLLYGTAGAGIFGNGRVSAPEAEAPTLNLNVGENRAGFVVGGGLEARLNPKMTVGVEGLYYGLDGSRDEKFGPSSPAANTLSDATIVRGRLTLRLGSESEPLK
jgi:outer membrane immunogenic protein